MRSAAIAASAAIVLGLGACAGTRPPPAELVNARAELVRAQSNEAARVNPAGLHDAEVALDRAEKAFADDPDSPVTRDLAYVAELKALSAETSAQTTLAIEEKERADVARQAAQADQLRSARGQVQEAQGNLDKTRQALDRQQQETAVERQKRLDAEQQLQSARETLAKIAQVKDDDRGTVVTFQSEALFRTAKSDLLPGAMAKLDQVAQAIKGQERRILVVGHTDNQGGQSEFNQALSERRARTVKDYLVSKGIPSDLIRAEGRGPSQPVADNSSLEGRAMNRRVEIILEPRSAHP